MREIKFRVWDPDLKHMYLYDENYILIDTVGCSAMLTENGLNYQNNYILMQYTGLTDCEGKEIYESDLVQCFQTLQNPNGEIVSIVMKHGIWSLKDHYYGNSIPFPIHLYHDFCYPLTLKVIGNIYENPDLLCNADKKLPNCS